MELVKLIMALIFSKVLEILESNGHLVGRCANYEVYRAVVQTKPLTLIRIRQSRTNYNTYFACFLGNMWLARADYIQLFTASLAVDLPEYKWLMQ